MKNCLIELLSDGSIGLDSDTSPESAAEQLIVYLMEWKRWNAKINLTAERDELSVINKHIYESLQYARVISPTGSLVDIGSGAGFPGIPVKIIRPKLEIVLIESQRKRANFLKAAIRSIELSKIQCVHGRVTDFPELIGKYVFGDWSTSFAGTTGKIYYLTDQNTIAELNPNTISLSESVTGFGEDNLKELYVITKTGINHNANTTGTIYKLAGNKLE